MPFSRLLPLAFAAALLAPAAGAGGESIILASTTSTLNSGLYDHILPKFTEKTGIRVHVVGVGTGQAIKMARRGDADVLLVHHKESEEAFVAGGHGVKRFDLMYNDFVIVGPASDPARVRGRGSAPSALRKIAESRNFFVSRGDDSGTHKKELSLWKAASVDARAASGTWYRETGSNMGATLNTAVAMGAYTLTDRSTWLKFRNKGALAILVEGDERLFNQYGVILVNPAKHPHVKAREGQALIDWLTGAEGQRAIASYRIDGTQAFFPNALTRRAMTAGGGLSLRREGAETAPQKR
ncbi:MAG: substrate-binding domain-containing protein [Proteobacteria bacterium]|nr:substrate-binding domain-containing protein [Pseudomonadota bacterium]